MPLAAPVTSTTWSRTLRLRLVNLGTTREPIRAEASGEETPLRQTPSIQYLGVGQRDSSGFNEIGQSSVHD
jgi:hypothetical protein